MYGLEEVRATVEDVQDAEQLATAWEKIGLVTMVVAFAAIGVFWGLMMAANEASKESHVSASGKNGVYRWSNSPVCQQ